VADLAVEVAVQLHVAGHPDDDPATGLHDRGEVLERPDVVLDVLQDVRANHDVVFGFIGGLCEIDLTNLEVFEPQGPLHAQRPLDRARLVVADHDAPGRELSRDVKRERALAAAGVIQSPRPRIPQASALELMDHVPRAEPTGNVQFSEQ
jgi:hypothetical protein